MDGACNAPSFNGCQWPLLWRIVAFSRRAIIIKSDACGGYHAITAYTLIWFPLFYGFSRYNPLPRFRVCLLKIRLAWRVCCQQRKYFRVHARCQDRAAARFCEKSSSFPTGERISLKNLVRANPGLSKLLKQNSPHRLRYGIKKSQRL